jgi:RimJ/RimL family protein N-acetyltransferase
MPRQVTGDTRTWLKPIELHGECVALVPLSHDHHDGLVEAAKDGELWTLWYTFVPDPAGMKAGINKHLELNAAGTRVSFTVIDRKRDKIVGMTNYLDVDVENGRVEIGGTWYAKSVQRTGLNTECKLLLLSHAFETMNCIAVEFRTHFFNHPSRRAIERLGAKLDGILRSHRISPNSTVRDTCVYSIISAEWPTVRSHLQWLLQRE